MGEQIYPTITITDPFLTRKTYMSEKYEEINRQLNHYKKLQQRWKKADSTLKVFTIGTTFVLGVGAAVSSGLAVPILPAVLPSVIAGQAFLNSTLIVGLTGKRKSMYRQKIQVINNYLNKIFILMEKIKDDGDISIEELKTFQKLIEELYREISLLNYKDKSESIQGFQTDGKFSTLSKNDVKKAETIAKENIKKKQIKNLATEIELRSTVTDTQESELK